MLLTITTTHRPATDLGFLLHKNPENLFSTSMSFGKAHVFYPEATEDRCTAALLLEVDPVGLVRKSGGSSSFALQQYVNDRPYVASSFMSVALNRVFRTLLSGQSKHRPELLETPIPLEVKIYVLPCRGGEPTLQKLFAPLGYDIVAERHVLDEKFSEWGNSPYYTVILNRTCPLREFLQHLYVLIPVLDNDKHYYIAKDEIDKLLDHGKGWLELHPEKELIARRYLPFRGMASEALARLCEGEEEQEGKEESGQAEQEEQLEKKVFLNDQRMETVIATLKAYNAKRILDLGCGEGNLLKRLLDDLHFEHLVGCDVSSQALDRAMGKIKLERLPSRQRRRITLMQTALTYRDKRLTGYDAATVIEVIEHLDLSRLEAFQRVLFEFAQPGLVIITTPNVEYNAMFETLPSGKFRHHDHRFEWTRQEFEDWSSAVAEKFGYTVSFESIGEVSEQYGAPTQMGVFVRHDG